MNAVGGWVAEQVSSDHTVIPVLDLPNLNAAVLEQVEASGPTVSKRVPRSWRTVIVAVGLLGIAGVVLWTIIDDRGDPIPYPEAEAPLRETTQRFVIDGDTMFLEGSVPDEGTSRRIETQAREALGDDRVVNNLSIGDDAVFDVRQPVELTMAETVLFSTGRADISDRYQPLIDLAVDLLESHERISLTLIGHTDSVGSHDDNARLSLQRAEATAGRFFGHGVDPRRIAIEGRGEFDPVADNDTADGRQANRRVEFLITGLLE